MVDPARGPGVAAHQPPDCQEESLDRPVGAYRPQSISRTRGVVATGGSTKWRDEPLVTADSSHKEQREQPANGHVPGMSCTDTQLRQGCHWDTTAAVPTRCPSLVSARPRAALTSADKSLLDASAERGSARITTSVPGARSSTWVAIRWRSCRVTRCRTTEPPTERPTMNPARESLPGSVVMTCTTTVGEAALIPARRTARKSSARRILRRTGSNGRLGMTRPRGGCDPCRGVRPERHVRRGCSFGSGTRACGRADGCSAGKCASWRHPCGWVISGEEPSPMGTLGRTDLFLVTKVRNALSTGQTHLPHAACDPTGWEPTFVPWFGENQHLPNQWSGSQPTCGKLLHAGDGPG